MRDEDEYFSDAEVVQYCECCGQELYHGDDCYRSGNEYFCSNECIKKYYDIERVEL